MPFGSLHATPKRGDDKDAGSVFLRLEQMRAQLEMELGEDVFMQAYRLTLAWQTSEVPIRPYVGVDAVILPTFWPI